MGIYVAIATIPPRARLLARSVRSVKAQTLSVDRIFIETDYHHVGGSAMRSYIIGNILADTYVHDDDWLGLMDDDDEMLPNHLELLVGAAEAAGVGVASSWFDVVAGTDPLPADSRGKVMDLTDIHVIPITYVARVGLFRQAFANGVDFDVSLPNSGYWMQDGRVLIEMIRLGGHVAIPETTWLWHHDSGNTASRPDRW